jgi:nucleotide-binding universal stress UspA family protein
MLKVLIAVDGSDHSIVTVRRVTELAPKVKDLSARLVNVQPETLNYEFHHGVAEDDAVRGEKALGERLLAQERKLLDAAGIPHEWSVELGDPAEAIVRVATESGCDMIVLGSHGLGGVASLLLGSVAMKVVQQANVPVLLVK